MSGLRCLSLHQPWASLVAVGAKTIETRSWAPKHRGRIGIASTARWPGHITIPPFSRSETREEHWNKRRWLTMPTITDPAFQGPQPQGKHIPRRAETPTLFRADRTWDETLGTSSIEQGAAIYLPLGALVATANLVDCVPIVGRVPNQMTDHVDHVLSLERGGNGGHGTPRELTLARAVERVMQPTPHRVPCWEPTDVTDQLPYGDFAPGRWAWLLDDVKPTTERCPACWGEGKTGRGRVDADELFLHGRLSATFTCRACDGNGKCDPIPVKGRQGLWTWAA